MKQQNVTHYRHYQVCIWIQTHTQQKKVKCKIKKKKKNWLTIGFHPEGISWKFKTNMKNNISTSNQRTVNA